MPRNAIAFEVSGDDHPDSRKPGAYYFMRAPAGLKVPEGTPIGIAHACPCGCGGKTALFFRGMPVGDRDMWDVTGEWPKATLSPSIGIRYDGAGKRYDNGFHWHGWLRAGVFEEG